MDNTRTMGIRAIDTMVDRPATREALYRTIQDSNSAGSIKPDGTIEDIEELETRGLNPYWDKQKFQNKLKEEAIKNNLLLPSSFLSELTLIHDKRKNLSAENDVYLSKENNTLIKVNDLSYVIDDKKHQNLNAFFDRIYAHNSLFPSVNYKFKGLVLNKHNEISVVLEQSFVVSNQNATQEEIDEYFTNNGFIKSNKREWSNAKEVWTNGKYELFDARPANVLKGKDNKLYFIDTFPHSTEYLQNENSKLKLNISNVGKTSYPLVNLTPQTTTQVNPTYNGQEIPSEITTTVEEYLQSEQILKASNSKGQTKSKKP